MPAVLWSFRHDHLVLEWNVNNQGDKDMKNIEELQILFFCWVSCHGELMTIILQTTRKLAALLSLLLMATRIAAHLPSCCRFPQGRSSNCPKKIKFCTYRRSSEALLCRKPGICWGMGTGGGSKKKRKNTDFGDTFGEVGGWHSHSCQTCPPSPYPNKDQIKNRNRVLKPRNQ